MFKNLFLKKYTATNCEITMRVSSEYILNG